MGKMSKKKKQQQQQQKKKKTDVLLGEQGMTSDKPIERRAGRDEAAGALVAALQEAARLGIRVAVDTDGYTILHGRQEERCGRADLSGIVVRRTPARRERAAATRIAQRRRPNAVAP
jgi:hypothetical protein